MDRMKRQLKSVPGRLYSRFKQEQNPSIEFSTTIRIERRSVTWTIDNVSRCPLNAGEYLESPTFNTGVSEITKWCLRFYPKGMSDATSSTAGLYLCKITPSTKVQVEVKLRVISKNCAEFEKAIFCNGSKQVCEEPEEIGTDKLISTKSLEVMASLVVECAMKVGCLPEAEVAKSCDAESHIYNCNCAMSVDFEKLYSGGDFSDAVLQVGKKQFKVHKAILAARSKVFFAMFEHDMMESKTGIVDIEDAEPSVIADVLQHIYTGKINNMDVDKAILLFQVADKYTLMELQKECSKILLENMSVANVCRIAVAADMHSASELKEAAIHFIRSYSTQVFDRGEWGALTVDKPRLAADILKNIVTDYKTNCSRQK